ncbi:hypothetical protein BTN49_1151 [Candidatus Enterovibrio escicola]|uniref:Uncharacterized protein n=1 Tax=Candidatus Enterovibrio escicola TaxID=1927127 RepID=A0A2A5T4R9_9GAMM|nr:hypothetical protein BTN49_1151 [Candidatus Enterovibrio escacola]
MLVYQHQSTGYTVLFPTHTPKITVTLIFYGFKLYLINLRSA